MRIWLLIALFVLASCFFWRMRPHFGKNESYNDFFPAAHFLAKVASPVPEWMERQIASDFKHVQPVTASALEKAYDIILKRLPEPIFLYHYRILDNQLYKYIPEGVPFAHGDTYYEKAFKTLLSHVRLPDLDFVICPMDGIPEEIVPSDFYFMENPCDEIPIFGQAKLKEPLTRQILLIPDQLSLAKGWYTTASEIIVANEQLPWSQKVGKVFWRGAISDARGQEVSETPRLTLCRLAKSHSDLLDIAAIYHVSIAELAEREGLPKLEVWATKFDHLHYKYQPVLDGNMCTYPGYQWRLLSNSLALKQESNQIQWFYGALEPYKHYLPIANDLSDLIEKIQWAQAHEPEVLKIIENAQKFASENLMYEDCYRYLYLALLKYAPLQQIDFTSLKKKTKSDPKWVNIHYRKRRAAIKRFRRFFLLEAK